MAVMNKENLINNLVENAMTELYLTDSLGVLYSDSETTTKVQSPQPQAMDGGSIISVSDMIKFIFTFGAGVYTGMYVSQNYDVPKVNEPAKIIETLKELVDQKKK